MLRCHAGVAIPALCGGKLGAPCAPVDTQAGASRPLERPGATARGTLAALLHVRNANRTEFLWSVSRFDCSVAPSQDSVTSRSSNARRDTAVLVDAAVVTALTHCGRA